MIFEVHHWKFGIDTQVRTTTLVDAVSKEEAVIEYNVVAKLRKDYPHFWNEAKIGDVFIPEILYKKVKVNL